VNDNATHPGHMATGQLASLPRAQRLRTAPGILLADPCPGTTGPAEADTYLDGITDWIHAGQARQPAGSATLSQ
jgi:hypothetical protein